MTKSEAIFENNTNKEIVIAEIRNLMAEVKKMDTDYPPAYFRELETALKRYNTLQTKFITYCGIEDVLNSIEEV